VINQLLAENSGEESKVAPKESRALVFSARNRAVSPLARCCGRDRIDLLCCFKFHRQVGVTVLGFVTTHRNQDL
jgi:hypothetical protein